MKPEQLQKAIDDCNIVFEGPILSERWPTDYKEVFQPIYAIRRKLYDEYCDETPVNGRGNTSDPLSVAEQINRVHDLVRQVYICRDHALNEETWRKMIEPKLFHRFETEVVCPVCRNQLWVSEFKALPSDSLNIASLSTNLLDGQRCRCNAIERARSDLYDPGRAPMFTYRNSERVILDDVPEVDGRRIRFKKPDHVHGLGITHSLRLLTSRRPSITHSPFRDQKLLYPFLLVEAKSDKRNPGSDSVECQTAFSIKQCLKLQTKLGDESGPGLHPLVWFFAFQGDKWTLYGCVPENAKTRVIQLWHNDIRDHDGALQICLIVDYLCDWARQEYRPNIIKCLAGGQVNPRDLTPALPPVASQIDEADLDLSQRFSSVELGLSDVNVTDNDMDSDQITDDLMEVENPFDVEDSDFERSSGDDFGDLGGDSRSQLLQWTRYLQTPTSWVAKATIRHTNILMVLEQHVRVPEVIDILEVFLLASFPNISLQDAASQLLTALVDDDVAITMKEELTLRLNQDAPAQGAACFIDGASSVRAILYCQHFIDFSDWQVKRRLSYLTCSQSAIEKLAKIAKSGPNMVPHFSRWKKDVRVDLKAALEALRDVKGTQVAGAALKQLVLHLNQVPTSLNLPFRWKYHSENCANGFTFDNLDNILTQVEGSPNLASFCLNQSETFDEIKPSGRASHVEIDSFWNDTGILDGILVKKAPNWPETCPLFCFLVWANVDFGDLGRLATMASETKEAGAIFKAQGGKVSRTDLAFLDKWIQIMKGEAPEDALAQWPIT